MTNHVQIRKRSNVLKIRLKKSLLTYKVAIAGHYLVLAEDKQSRRVRLIQIREVPKCVCCNLYDEFEGQLATKQSNI